MVTFKVSISGPDPDGIVRQAAESAGRNWASHLTGSASIEVSLTVKPLSGNAIAQAWSPLYYADASGTPYRSASAEELRSGIDLTPDGPDIFIDVDPVKSAGTDLVAVLEHELAHGIFMNSIGRPDYLTDLESETVGGLFSGSAAMAIYGQPVPMEGAHVALPGLMNAVYDAARHPHISILDIAIANDLGVPTRESFGTKDADRISADPAGQEVWGGFGADSLSGRQGADTLYGNQGDDSIRGGKGNDLLYGGADGDTIRGDRGNDTLYGGPGSDLFCFGDDDGIDHIRDFEFALGGGGDRLQFASTPEMSVDYASYSLTLKAGNTTVILDNFIVASPEIWAVG